MTNGYLHARMTAQAQGLDGAKRLGLAKLRAELNLTPEQERVVTRVLDDYGKYYQNIEDEREDVAEHGKQRILDVLTFEQRQKFLRMFGETPQ